MPIALLLCTIIYNYPHMVHVSGLILKKKKKISILFCVRLQEIHLYDEERPIERKRYKRSSSRPRSTQHLLMAVLLFLYWWRLIHRLLFFLNERKTDGRFFCCCCWPDSLSQSVQELQATVAVGNRDY